MEKDVRNLSIAELRAIAQANCSEKDTLSKSVRIYSIYFTKWFLKIGLSANKISILFMLSLCMLGICLFLAVAFRNWIYYVPALFFFFLHLILDDSDGEVARATKTANPLTGKVMDGICHWTGDCCVLVGIIFGLSYRLDSMIPLYLGVILFWGKFAEDQLGERIIRSVRLHEARSLNIKKEEKVVNESTKRIKKDNIIKRLIKSITTACPDNGLLLFVFLSFFHDTVLLIYFLLWTIFFHIRWIMKIIRYMKAPSTYLS